MKVYFRTYQGVAGDLQELLIAENKLGCKESELIPMIELPTWLQELWELDSALARRAEKHYLELIQVKDDANKTTLKIKDMELKASELRIGNYVTINNKVYHPSVKSMPLEIRGIQERIIQGEKDYLINLEHINQQPNKYYVSYSQYLKFIEPIPLTKDWLIRMKDNKNKSTFPDWIKYVHEAQNWYYWNNNKTELIISES